MSDRQTIRPVILSRLVEATYLCLPGPEPQETLEERLKVSDRRARTIVLEGFRIELLREVEKEDSEQPEYEATTIGVEFIEAIREEDWQRASHILERRSRHYRALLQVLKRHQPITQADLLAILEEWSEFKPIRFNEAGVDVVAGWVERLGTIQRNAFTGKYCRVEREAIPSNFGQVLLSVYDDLEQTAGVNLRQRYISVPKFREATCTRLLCRWAAFDEGEVLLSELVPLTIERLSSITKFADFTRAMVHMVYEDTRLYAWQWLTAEGIRYEQRNEMEIHSSLADDTAAVRAFTSLNNLLWETGYTAVFVDEFESISRLSPKEKQSTLNSVRHLMDQNSRGLSVLFGCEPEVWQDVMSEYHAFSERIGQEVALRPLTDRHITNLVSSYLDTVRDDSLSGTTPFEASSVELVHQRSQGNVRQALSLCSQLLDRAVDENIERIEAEDVEQVLTSE